MMRRLGLGLVAVAAACCALCCECGLRAATEEEAADAKLLKDNGITSDGPGLLDFFKRRSLSEEDQKKLEACVRQLGADDFNDRESAARKLVDADRLAIRFLQAALTDPDPEVVRRARECLEQIKQGPGPMLPAAAVRSLARSKPEGSVAALVRFLPFNDDELVEEETLAALTALGIRDGKLDPVLREALTDKHLLRRAAAGHVAGRVKETTVRDAVLKLLDDSESLVRFRTAQGLIAGGERKAVPALVAMLSTAPQALAWQAESILLQLAGEGGPTASAGKGTDDERKAWQKAWDDWWKEKGDKVDLAKALERRPFLGLVVVAEMHGAKVWECGKDGSIRWQLDNLAMPRVAWVVGNGRVLVGEVTTGRVTERDLKGNVLWSHPFGDVAYVERLPNGNTFIGSHQRAIEVTPAGKEVWSYQSENGFFIHSMNRKPNGHLVCLSMDGRLREVDRAGKEVFTVTVAGAGGGGNWCGVQGLPGDRYLCVELSGQVIEVDRTGKSQWSCNVPGASYAWRMPTGNTLVCSFSGQRVVEVDRKGAIVWEKKVGSSPWRAYAH
jgi:HEAT repeat protein